MVEKEMTKMDNIPKEMTKGRKMNADNVVGN